jgi:hypothetical protein
MKDKHYRMVNSPMKADWQGVVLVARVWVGFPPTQIDGPWLILSLSNYVDRSDLVRLHIKFSFLCVYMYFKSNWKNIHL